MRPVGPARHCQAYVLFGLCIGVQLSSRRVVARRAGEEELMTADALRWHVLLRKPTIVERLDCERLLANRDNLQCFLSVFIRIHWSTHWIRPGKTTRCEKGLRDNHKRTSPRPQA